MPILCVCLNAAFSGSYQSALNAAEELREEFPGVQAVADDMKFHNSLLGFVARRTVAGLRPVGNSIIIAETGGKLNHYFRGGSVLMRIYRNHMNWRAL